MQTKFVEVTNGPLNWGKFLLMRFDEEDLAYRSVVAGGGWLLALIGWNPKAIWVLDLQTCEGVAVKPGGLAAADLHKHRVWVCPMFEPFLDWLYKQPLPLDFGKIPPHVDLPEAEFAMSGYRRPGGAAAVRLRQALEEIAKETISVPCDDPQCGDSTWDHECTAGRRVPSSAAKKAMAALT